MPEKLPKGWVKTTLGEIVELSRERILPSEIPDAFYIGLEHIEPQTMRLLGHLSGRDVRSSSIRFSKGDVLYGKMRPYLNKVWIAEFDGICSAEFLVFRRREELNSQFLAMHLNADDFVAFANGQVSGERPRVDFEKLAPFLIHLPPIAEQVRIVAKLNASISAVERAEAAARRARDRLKTYSAAVLEAAVTGALTRNWRETQSNNRVESDESSRGLLRRLVGIRRARWEETEFNRLRRNSRIPKDDKWKLRYAEPTPPPTTDLPALPKGWIWLGWEQVGFSQNGRSFPSKEYSNAGIKLLRPGNLYADGTVRWTEKNTRFIPPKWEQENPEFLIRGNELVINLTAQSLKDDFLGRVCLTSEGEHCLLNQRLARLTPVLGMPKFFLYMFKSSVFRGFVEGLNSGSLIQHMFTSQLTQFALPFPPEMEQAEIVSEVERRLASADRLAIALEQQFARAIVMRQSLLREAFAGRLVPQRPDEEPALALLARLRKERSSKPNRRRSQPNKKKRTDPMQDQTPSFDAIKDAWERTGGKADARELFDEAGFGPDHVVQFYEALCAIPELRSTFQAAAQGDRHQQSPIEQPKDIQDQPSGRFRLVELWLEDFKNLMNYTVRFNPTQGLDIILGWNGTGKSNLFEALVIIFRDLHDWSERNRWPEKPMKGFHLIYEMDEHTVEVTWKPAEMKRPELNKGPAPRNTVDSSGIVPIKRDQLPLPRFVFGYYSGPTNRLAEHFLPMKQAHYIRLREAKDDDATTLAKLLEQRRFFCAETHHAKYVLLAFSYKRDEKISEFLENRLRILAFESALFVIRKPRWAQPGSKPENFWDAKGIMRRVMERLRRYAITPMVLEQTVNYGYQSTKEDHYFFLLPDLETLHAFAAEYQDARTFFLRWRAQIFRS